MLVTVPPLVATGLHVRLSGRTDRCTWTGAPREQRPWQSKGEAVLPSAFPPLAPPGAEGGASACPCRRESSMPGTPRPRTARDVLKRDLVNRWPHAPAQPTGGGGGDSPPPPSPPPPLPNPPPPGGASGQRHTKLLGSANAETTPAGAAAAAADRTQRPDATCEGKNG